MNVPVGGPVVDFEFGDKGKRKLSSCECEVFFWFDFAIIIHSRSFVGKGF